MTRTACPFCMIVQGEVGDVREVYRDEHVVAFFPLEPATLGHTLVVPRTHIPDIWSLDEDSAAHIARVTTRLSKALRHVIEPDGLNIIQSNGAVASQTVFHLHVHIVPRWSDDDVAIIWPSKSNVSEAETDEVRERLRRGNPK